jgi:hypothetical protein
MTRKAAQQGLTQQDVDALCDTAQEAWAAATSSARQVCFSWRKKRYKSVLTPFKMLVQTLQGIPVAARYP